MKRRDLERRLRMAGCLLKREGASHSIWINPATGVKEAVPRHNEITGVGLVGSRRVLGSSKGSTTAGLEPDFGTGRAERERRQWRPLDQVLDVLWQAGAWREQLIQLLLLLAERCERRLHPLPWALPVPLRVHGHYSRAEIEAAHCYAEACGYGVLTDDAPWIHREGVLWHQPSATDLLFITLRKSEALFSPSTRYRDLALGPSLFHWESQSTTTTSSPTG